MARIVVPGVPHHAIQRGGRRLRTFFCDDDYRLYLALLAEASERRGLAIVAYCLMPNHVHLIAVPSAPGSLADTLRIAHREYAERINLRFGWTGHLWQERFGSCPMDEHHARNALRYVLLNPVRAGLVDRAEKWPWSSARALLDGGVDFPLVLSSPPRLSRAEAHRFLSEPLSEHFPGQLHRFSRTGKPLGSDGFLAELESKLGRPLRRPARGRRPRQPSPTPFRVPPGYLEPSHEPPA